MNILLQGFSGCSIRIEPWESSHRVVKSTDSAAYAPRLIRQADKQAIYRRCSLPPAFRIPAIHEVSSEEGQAAIYMEYSRGIDIISYLSVAGADGIEWLQRELAGLVDVFCATSALATVARAALEEKLAITLDKISASGLHQRHVAPMAADIVKRFSTLPPELTLPVGECHGDLTLSNILIDPLDSHIVLIDFLDSFIETPLMDMVKLRQDTSHAWSMLIYGGDYPSARLREIMSSMDAFFDAHFRRYACYAEYYHHFQLLSLLRILPYLREERLIRAVAASAARELDACN